MDLIHCAEPFEIVLNLDLRYDLDTSGDLLDTHDPFDELGEEEIERREEENNRRVEQYEEAYLSTLRTVAAEQHVTVYVGGLDEATTTYRDADAERNGDKTIEQRIWQEAHDRTPLPWKVTDPGGHGT